MNNMEIVLLLAHCERFCAWFAAHDAVATGSDQMNSSRFSYVPCEVERRKTSSKSKKSPGSSLETALSTLLGNIQDAHSTLQRAVILAGKLKHRGQGGGSLTAATIRDNSLPQFRISSSSSLEPASSLRPHSSVSAQPASARPFPRAFLRAPPQRVSFLSQLRGVGEKIVVRQ